MASDHTSPQTSPAVHRNDAAHRYEVLQDGHRAGAMYERTGDVITFTHTIVPAALEGQGIGAALVRHALDDARAHGWRVIPVCPFVRAYLARHPEFRDLLVPGGGA
jgi:predicted GNAT family acetyltransferase